MNEFTGPSEVWPDHAGHSFVYSEHGRTDYILTGLHVVTEDDGSSWIDDIEHDNLPTDGDISTTEYWCATCGMVLSYDGALKEATT